MTTEQRRKLTIVATLPRCRTAWLSELLTIRPESFAFHEGKQWGYRDGDIDNGLYVQKLLSRPEGHIIDCDPAFWMDSTQKSLDRMSVLNKHFDVNMIQVLRPVEDIFNSWYVSHGKELGLSIDSMKEHLMMQVSNLENWCHLERSGRLPKSEFYDFAQLDALSPVILEKLGLPVDKDRIAELHAKIIVQNLAEMQRRYA